MKKLTLELQDLRVESFATTSPGKARGTVFGEQCTCNTVCTCPGCATCDVSCNGTCDAACPGTPGATCDYSCYAHDSCMVTCNTMATFVPDGGCVEC